MLANLLFFFFLQHLTTFQAQPHIYKPPWGFGTAESLKGHLTWPKHTGRTLPPPWQHGKQTGSCLSTRNSALKAFPSLSTQEGSCQCLSDQPVCLVQPDATLMNQREVFSRLEHQTDGTHSAKTLCLPVRAGVSLYINLQHKLAPPEQQLQHYQEITCGLFFFGFLISILFWKG